MKTRIRLILILFTILASSCSTKNNEGSTEQWKDEIIATEKAFAKMAEDKGIPQAFLAYAADDAVLLRNNKLIIGKDSLRSSFENAEAQNNNVSLTWEPDFVDVSASGDLGYTYGTYLYVTTDSTGAKNEVKGVFHTVWKRQPDGKWKYVWD